MCDLVNGWLIYQLLVSEILPFTFRAKSTNNTCSSDGKHQEPGREAGISAGSSHQVENTLNVNAKNEQSTLELSSLATLYTALHLFNPLVFTISTRGSSESVLALFVLLTLYAAVKSRWCAAAVMLGVSAHWKIYPVVYGVACLAVVGAEAERKRSYLRTLINMRTMSFAMVSAGTFGVLGAACYLV